MPFDLAAVRARLPDRHIEWYRSVTSTMTLAARMAHDGCPAGTIVGADEQAAGIGRHGHSWYSEAEAGLYVSIVLRLPLEWRELPIVMLALGLATQEAITEVTSLAPDLRWPNDVLLADRKCAGILAQLEGDAIVAGIGVNVNHSEFPRGLEPIATSLRLSGASAVSREDLLVALAHAVERCCKILTEEGGDAIVRLFARASSYAQGRRVRAKQDGAIIEGVTAGLDRSGFLVLRQDNGKEIAILAGGVRSL
jgi:BirA family biotin operon repressor/biotin-[acetyl-CoA-carboxylase] ligase